MSRNCMWNSFFTLFEATKDNSWSPERKNDDLVLIQDDSTTIGCGPKTEVKKTMPDAVNLLRRVRIRSGDGGTLMRDVKICTCWKNEV